MNSKTKKITTLVVSTVAVIATVVILLIGAPAYSIGETVETTNSVATTTETITTQTMTETTTSTAEITTATTETTTTTEFLVAEITTTRRIKATTEKRTTTERIISDTTEFVNVKQTTTSFVETKNKITEAASVTTENSSMETTMTEIVENSFEPSVYEKILLCNLVAREYGSNYVPTKEKAKVVAVVMNRVKDSRFPNTIYGVLTQPKQFSGYVVYNKHTSKVTEDVIKAVDYYFDNASEFNDKILYFYGDGRWNYFYYINEKGKRIYPESPIMD